MAVGVNCTPPELITDLLRSAKSDKPYVVYPNSGRLWDAVKKEWTGSEGVGFDEKLVSEWKAAGAQYIGGCCGIGAAEISLLK
jgi:homocysteine S-methyltransferase